MDILPFRFTELCHGVYPAKRGYDLPFTSSPTLTFNSSSWRGCSLRSPSLGFSPENKKQPPRFAWFFCFLKSPSESKLSSGLFKNKNPLAGVVVFCFNVELAGVEPASKHGDHMLSTCLFLLDFRDLSAAEQPNKSLFPVCFALRPEKPSD
jgi:hypothetical protein